MKRLMRFAIVAIAVVMMVPKLSMADIYMKQKMHSDSMKVKGQSQPAKDVISEIWMTRKGFRSDTPEHSTILLADEKKVITLDHAKKTYMEQPLNMDEMMDSMPKGKGPQDKAAMKNMMHNMMKMNADVKETNDQKTINGWKCRKYIATIRTAIGTTTNEIWATEDLKVDKKIYDQMASRMLSSMPGMQSSMESFQKEMEKIKGVQVLTESSVPMMNQPHRSKTELIEFKEKTAPAGIFTIPAGYTKQDRNKRQ